MAKDILALVSAAVLGDDDAASGLAEEAKRDPQLLAPWWGKLLQAGVLYPPFIYLGADDSAQGELVDAIDRGFAGNRSDLNHALLALANAGGEKAEVAFRRWNDHPPPGAQDLNVPVVDYTIEAGWTLAPAAGRRYLCSQSAFSLDVKVASLGQEPNSTCPFCRSPLWVVFDLNLSDKRVHSALSHTGWIGRLRVLTCQFCACYGPLFSDVRSDGTSGWSEMSQRPAYLPASAPANPAQPLFSVGAERPSPYMASAWDRGGSTLGGFPEWIDDAAYLKCARCGEMMDYVALVGGADIAELGEGAYYVSLHARCSLAGVSYQQS